MIHSSLEANLSIHRENPNYIDKKLLKLYRLG